MNRFFIDHPAEDNDSITDKEDIKHIAKVLRLKSDDLIEVVDSNHKEYIMKIATLNNDNVELIKVKNVDINRETDFNLKLYQGIPKGQKMDLICQKATEIGVSNIIPVKFERCVSDDINKNKHQRLSKIIQEASKQSKRQIIPKLYEAMTFKEMIEDLKQNDKNIVFYENEDNKTIKDFIKSVDKKITNLGVIIGPEGGISEEEISIMKNNNVEVLTLGKRILRTETAGLVSSSILIYELENSDLKNRENI